jgi:hypothetical protein
MVLELDGPVPREVMVQLHEVDGIRTVQLVEL